MFFSSLKKDINYFGQKNNLSIITDAELIELQNFLANMLLDIIRVCDKYHITYFMGGGSCLGTVRHHGFIPWDDDLDINMPREDYERFKAIFAKELGEKYILNAPNYSSETIARFPKILAKGTYYSTNGFTLDEAFEKVFIDIFIMENVPKNPFYRMLKGAFVNVMEFISGQVFIYQSGKKHPENIIELIGKRNYRFRSMIGFLFSFYDYTKWCEIIDRAVRYSGMSSGLVCFPTGRKHYFGEILARNIMFPPKKKNFGNLTVSVPANYKVYLRNLYGDTYMQVPSPEKREKHFISRLDLHAHTD